MKKRLYLFVMFALGICGLRAQYVAPSEGVFRIVNVGYNAALMEDFVSHTLHCTANIGDNDDYEQLWILKQMDGGYSLQNVFTGAYVQTGNSGTEVNYWTGTAAKKFNIVSAKNANAYNIWDTGLSAGQGLHSKGANGNVVRWVACDPSEWRFVSVSLTDEDIAKARAEYERLTGGDKLPGYQAVLDEVFKDAACTVLSDKFAAMSADAIQAELTGKIPEALVAMAVKVKLGDWSETNENPNKKGWDSDYAKKFRVQLVEPYSIAGEITEWFGYNAHTNMDNPMGVYANKREVLYIMVEGEVKEGAELWATWIVGHSKMPNYNGGYSNGMRLKPGLNLVPLGSDGSSLYINYLVHTYDKQNHKFPHKLSEYDDLKVHVEGGYINSYYNAHGDALYTADTDKDWMYYEERANLRNITILGRHQILQFELNDVTITEEKDGKTSTWTEKGLARLFPEQLPTSLPENQRINAIVEAWDRIMLSELMTLGVVSKEVVDSMNLLYPRYDAEWVEKAEMYNYEGYTEFCRGRDYGEYYNHHGLAYGTVSGYMYGGWDHCGYHINTTGSILGAIATEAGPAWGPAHEIGHQHQGLFTVNGLTEVTNNLFSNIAVWYMGFGTSRVNGTSGSLPEVYKVFMEEGDFFNNNIWALTQMYYRLWLYYHRAGNNTQFYPRLFELLREKRLSGGYNQQGKTSILRFYQHCCDAAQEDLTEFFRAYGFFRVMKNRLVGDYSNSEYTQSQADIDAVIASVKAKGYPVNTKPLFINDCTPAATYSHDGKTQRSYWDGGNTTSGTNAQLGLYVDFMKGDSLSGKYYYTLSDLSIKIEGGKGALGFAVYDDNNAIQAFANHSKFALTQRVADMLNTGEARVVAIAAVEGEVEVPSRAAAGSETEQIAALREKLAEVKKYMELSDATGDKAGYFIPDSIADLGALKEKVEKVLAESDQSEATYGQWYTRLAGALTKVLTNEKARVPVYPNCYYAIIANDNPLYSISYASAGLRTTSAGATDHSNQWFAEPASTEGVYYLKNRESGYYISAANNGVRAKAATTKVGEALAFRLVQGEPGQFMLQRNDNADISLTLNSSRQVEGGKGSWWNMTVADDMLGLPEEGTDDKVVIYHIQCVDNDSYLYKSTNKRTNGRVTTGQPTDENDNNFWFYVKKGGVNGDKYRIYNYSEGKSITLDGNYYVANKDIEVFIEYTLTPASDRSGLVVSSVDGYWNVIGGNLAVSSTESSRFRFIKIGEATNTSIESTEVDTEAIGTYYDLTGRIVTKPTKGIYIHQGKKVMIK